MHQAEYNHEDFNLSQQQKQDETLFVKFFLKSVEDKAKTLEEGRPIFKDIEYIDIRVSGKRDSLACRPASFQDKKRFQRHYEAYKNRTEMPLEGTPLSEWPQIARSQIEELSFLNCKTVEQLCEVSDTHISQMRGGYTLKQKAQEWMKAAEKSKVIAQNLELKAKQAETDEQMAEMQKTLALMQAKLEESEAEKPAVKTTVKKAKKR